MLDIIKKSIYLGLGIATTTKEKVESLVDELIQKGELAKEEKSKSVQEILDKLEKSEDEFKEKTSAVVKETLNKLEYATQKDIQELKETISDLKKRISAKFN
jgi:polyhydroxyalkanoate synthesis regulator phasin